jgi:hypothetical protein
MRSHGKRDKLVIHLLYSCLLPSSRSEPSHSWTKIWEKAWTTSHVTRCKSRDDCSKILVLLDERYDEMLSLRVDRNPRRELKESALHVTNGHSICLQVRTTALEEVQILEVGFSTSQRNHELRHMYFNHHGGELLPLWTCHVHHYIR